MSEFFFMVQTKITNFEIYHSKKKVCKRKKKKKKKTGYLLNAVVIV